MVNEDVSSYFNSRFDGIDKKELLNLANVISFTWGFPLKRKDRRTKKSLYTWFNERWDEIRPLLDNFILILDTDGNLL